MITPDMTIEEILRRHPRTADVFRRFGLACGDCQVAALEDLEHGASVHHVDLPRLVAELNRAAGSDA